ncbi:MAG: thiamine pyrophosphate-dependent enzyme [Pseudomonadota bacterium]
MRHGGQILIDQLRAQQCDTIFCVPGESFLAALDGLHDANDITTVVCRQEGGAAIMAEADGKLTGRPGVVFVTRGPGATNASIGVHIARQDSTPLVMFVGLPARDMEQREAFQEFDLEAVFGGLAKSVEVIRQTARIPEVVSRAFHAAVNGRPGPVVVGLPEDMLSGAADCDDVPEAVIAETCAPPQTIDRIIDGLSQAKRPLVIVGGPGWCEQTRAAAEAFAAQSDLPIAASFRCQDYIDNAHPNYVGHVGIGVEAALGDAVRNADYLIVVGARLGEMTTGGYKLVRPPLATQQLVHVYPDVGEIGRVYRPAIGVAASSRAFFSALATRQLPASPGWGGHRAALREAYEAFRAPVATPGAIRLEDIVLTLDDLFDPGAIVANGAGNYTAWVHRYRGYRQYRTQLAPTAGAMGYGVPAAIAAALRYDGRQVVAFAGDGCFLMNGQELATAAQYGVRLLTIVVNNGMYGTIRMHQARQYPGRVHGTSLSNPDFVGLARAYGGEGEHLSDPLEIRAALKRGLSSSVPYLIEVPQSPDAITPATTLEAIEAV